MTRTLAIAFSRIAYCGLSAVTLTCSSCAARPTVSVGDAELERRLGEVDHRRRRLVVLASYQKLCHHASGSFQPQVKNEYHGASRIRPRSASTLT